MQFSKKSAYFEPMSRERGDKKESFEERPVGDVNVMQESKRMKLEYH
jgi:hypothetical protein